MKKILLVGDFNTSVAAGSIHSILESNGYQVMHVPGKKGHHAALGEKPDLILCDMSSSVGDVVDAIIAVQKHPFTNHIPVLTAGSGGASGLQQGRAPKEYENIAMPLGKRGLLKKVRSILGNGHYSAKAGAPKNDWHGTSMPATFFSDTNIVSFRKKERIYRENMQADTFFFVRSGRLRAYRNTESGKELIVDLFAKGDLFGYTALFNRLRYLESVEAIENTDLALIPNDLFQQWLIAEPAAGMQVFSEFAEKVNELEGRLGLFAYGSLRQKVAGALLLVAGKYAGNIKMSRENLAGVAGTAVESLIRTLAQFRSEKLIDIRKSGIILLNKNALKNTGS